MVFNALLGCFAAVMAALYWNEPASQFMVGANTSLALWCFVDFLKELVEYQRGMKADR